MEIYKIYRHNPPHLFRPNTKYMITGSTYHKKNLLQAPKVKERLLRSIIIGCNKYSWQLDDWVILDNHFHIMMTAPNESQTLSKFINEVYKFTAIWLKKNIPKLTQEKKIFYNYWDTCVTFERSYFGRLNYIYYNPVKHGYVMNAKDYLFGSFYYRIKANLEHFNELKKDYPWDRVDVYDDF